MATAIAVGGKKNSDATVADARGDEVRQEILRREQEKLEAAKRERASENTKSKAQKAKGADLDRRLDVVESGLNKIDKKATAEAKAEACIRGINVWLKTFDRNQKPTPEVFDAAKENLISKYTIFKSALQENPYNPKESCPVKPIPPKKTSMDEGHGVPEKFRPNAAIAV